jgi:biofilm PGA synthesis lipoprotein PgaB
MKNRTALWIIILIWLCTGTALARPGVTALCYHHVGDYYQIGPLVNKYTVTPGTLRTHFDYLKENGYRAISMEEYIRYNRGEISLPEKSVLLTFDDAYVSFYEQVFPLLQEYRYPALLAMVGIWQEVPPADPDRILTWQQARELEESGLVEIASHSYNLHYMTTANRFGDVSQAATTLEYANGRFEDRAVYERRVRADLQRSQQVFADNLGHPVRVMVWPYGEYNSTLLAAARDTGHVATFGLTGGFNPPGPASLTAGKRGIVYENPDISRFAKFLAAGGVAGQKQRVVQLDLDSLFDANPRQFEANINQALDRIFRGNANTVYLQAFDDSRGDGDIQSVYFHNSVAPVKADVFDHVVRRLQNRGFQVYAWLPTLSGQWLTRQHPEDVVTAYDDKGKGWYRRATPFSPRVREQLRALVRELALYTPIDGILFQDDLYLNDYEDFSSAAQAAFSTRFGRKLTSEILRDPAIRRQWTRMKAQALTDLTLDLMDSVREFRPQALSARNIYAEAVLNPQAVEWFAQDYRAYLKTYDYTVVMAYPYMEKQGARAVEWLGELAAAALSNKPDATKVVFKLQNYDWRENRWLARTELSRQVRALQERGALNIGFYPENLFSDRHDDSPF